VADTDPKATERLHEYWVHGEGAAKIQWGAPGDFSRCVVELSKYVKEPQAYCAQAHHDALGIWPATHAAEDRKATGRSQVTLTQRAEMATASINDLPDSDFAYIEPGGTKDGSGRTTPRSLRHFPVQDADHVRNALSRAPQSPFGDKAMPRIKAAAKKFGVDVADQPATASRGEFMRMYPLEDIHILRSEQGGDGRVVEAYAAVFGQQAEIQDFQGHYLETIHPSAFDRAIDHASRARGGFPGAVKVLYNHGMTIQGTPSERFSVPIGVPVEIRAEARGLLTRTRYSGTPLADEILESVRAGSITSQSFTGKIWSSDPELRRGGRYRGDAGASLPTVRRTRMGLREYGPVLWPAYTGAEILGVRMSTPGEGAWDQDEQDENEGAGTPSHEGPAAGDQLAPESDEHSARYHQHQLFLLRAKEQREAAGLVW
jgi:HK97 family phage prohead protease